MVKVCAVISYQVLYVLCLYWVQISGERLQDHCSSCLLIELIFTVIWLTQPNKVLLDSNELELHVLEGTSLEMKCRTYGGSVATRWIPPTNEQSRSFPFVLKVKQVRWIDSGNYTCFCGEYSRMVALNVLCKFNLNSI